MSSRARPHAHQLFNKYDFYSLEEHQRQAMVAAIDSVDAGAIVRGDIEEMTREFTDRYALEAPTLIEGALSVTVDEAKIEVTNDFRYGVFGSERAVIPGISVSYFVPFSGDPQLFDVSGSMRNLSMRPIELRKGELVFTYQRTDQNVGATKEEFDKEIAQVKQSLGWLRQDCQKFSALLPTQARERILSRKARLMEVNQNIASLGIPIRRPAEIKPEPPSAKAPINRSTTPKSEQYDIALSFAGEDRAYVERVATGLKDAGVHVFYDKFESAQLWGKNLIDHLAEIYRNSRYVVMFISQAYVAKAWTNHERKHAQDRSLFAQEEYILPARFDDTEVPGMTTTVAFQDLRHTEPAELVALILAKLGR